MRLAPHVTATNTVLLEASARVEIAAQELYAELAAHLPYEPQLRKLLQRLAAEEAEHALRVRRLLAHHARPLWSRERVARCAAVLDGMTAEIEASRVAFQARAETQRPGSLIRQLVDMETRFNRFHAVELARSVEPRVNEFFATLSVEDAAHRELLQMARTRMGT